MLTIKKATVDDAPIINKITKSAFGVYQDELSCSTKVTALSESDKDVIADINNHAVFIALDNNKLVGAIRICKLSSELAYIYRFAVDPSAKNTGIGSELLNSAIDYAKIEKLTALALHTNSKYYKLARYYYGRNFFVHSTDASKGYIRALFLKELQERPYDIAPAFKK